MSTYEAPTLTEVGSVRELTKAQFLSDGTDNMSFIFGLFGS